MATKKKDFAAADRNRYSGIIGGIEESETAQTGGATSANNSGTRHYNRLDPRKEAPAEYKYTARMPGEYGRFLNELAYQRRSTITAEIQRLVREEMERHPEIMASLDELNS